MVNPFALPDEVEELRLAAARFADEVLAPAVRTTEGDGAWPESANDVVARFVAGTDTLARTVLLETLATGDAGGLPAADPLGPLGGALSLLPDRATADGIASDAAGGTAGVALLVTAGAGPDGRPPRLEWAPGRPPLRRVLVSTGDRLQLLELSAPARPVTALAFAASGGVTADMAGAAVTGDWDLGPGRGVAVRGRARLWAAAVAIGVAQAAFDATVEYTTERVVFGLPVAHHQGNAFELAAAATGLHAARLSVRDAARAVDHDDADAGFWATQAWLTAVDAAVTVTDLGVQLLGGHGFLVDHLAEKRFREARMLGLLAGGRDVAEDDAAALVLDVVDPIAPAGRR